MHFHQWKRREFIATLGGALPLANVRSWYEAADPRCPLTGRYCSD